MSRQNEQPEGEPELKLGLRLADSAVRDRIGKGHSVEIAPLSGILAKLKAQRQEMIARWVL